MDGQAWDPFTTLASGGSSSALPASSPTDELYLAWFEQADTGASLRLLFEGLPGPM